MTPRTATPDGSASATPTAGEPVDPSSPDRYWWTTADREVLFNLPATLAS